jgi:biopolymer transport protein ExbD
MNFDQAERGPPVRMDMAGVNVDSGGGRRRAVDSEINMVPMIDLLMVTVSFLLLTAVWTHMGRIEGTSQVQGLPDPSPPVEHARMHVDVPTGESAFVITVRRGNEIVETANVPRETPSALGSKLDEMRRTHPGDLAGEESRTVVLHTDNELRYREMVAVMDGISGPRDPRGNHGEPEFHVNLATK